MWGQAQVYARGDSGLVDWRDKNALGGKEAGDEMAVRSRTIRNAGHQGSWLPDKRCEAYIQDGVGPRQVRVISAGIRPRSLDVLGSVANKGDRSRLRASGRVGPGGNAKSCSCVAVKKHIAVEHEVNICTGRYRLEWCILGSKRGLKVPAFPGILDQVQRAFRCSCWRERRRKRDDPRPGYRT